MKRQKNIENVSKQHPHSTFLFYRLNSRQWSLNIIMEKYSLGVTSKPGYVPYCKYNIGVIADGMFVARERPDCYVITEDI